MIVEMAWVLYEMVERQISMMEMKKKMIVGVIVIISVVLGIYSYIVLPEVVTVQMDFSGNPSNTYPKILAVGLPMLFSIGGGLGYSFFQEKKNYLIISMIGILLLIVTLLFNK